MLILCFFVGIKNSLKIRLDNEVAKHKKSLWKNSYLYGKLGETKKMLKTVNEEKKPLLIDEENDEELTPAEKNFYLHDGINQKLTKELMVNNY